MCSLKMRHGARLLSVVASFVVATGYVFATDGTWVWRDGVGTSVTNTADWFDERNWAGETLPSNDGTAEIQFPTVSGIRYIRADRAVALRSITKAPGSGSVSAANRIVIVSDFPFSFAGGKSPMAVGVNIYADVTWPSSNVGWISDWTLCGDMNDDAYVQADAGFTHRLDMYANAAGELRVNPGPTNRIQQSSTGYRVYAPHGSAVNVTGQWRMEEGSRFLVRTGSAHVLSVGTLVHGVGIREGTYLKRVFTDSSIELSLAATSSLTGTVTFDAFSPKVRQYVGCWQHNVADRDYGISAMKYREEDELRLEIGELAAQKAGVVPVPYRFDTDTGYVAGTMVLHDATLSGHEMRVGMAHIEFAGKEGGVDAGFPNSRMVQYAAGNVAQLTVTNGLSASILAISNYVGTIIKDGGGTLSAALEDAVPAAGRKLEIRAGTFELRGDSERSIAVLAISNGATLKLPAGGLRVDSLYAQPGAIVTGDGRLSIVGEPDGVANLVFLDGAVVDTCPTGPLRLSPPEGEVVGTPAAWFDAKKQDSFVLDGTSVLRWNDRRGGDVFFATNIIRRPSLVSGDRPYVDFQNVNTRDHTNMNMLVWSKPLTSIKAIFIAEDATPGGGVILGRTARVNTGTGGHFYRIYGNNWTSPLVHGVYANANVRNGRFYINGREIDGTAKGYLGPDWQVVESHPADAGATADAFGCSYADGGTEASMNGYKRIGECIVYTNALTYAERLKVAQYLMNKWCGRDAYFAEGDERQMLGELSAEGGGVYVPEGTGVEAKSVSGDGVFVKSGAGMLYVKSVEGGTLQVDAGTVKVRSLSFTRADLPAHGYWAHFDAMEDSSLTKTTENGEVYVSEWSDISGTGVKLKKAIYGGARFFSSNSFYRVSGLNGKPCVDTGPLVVVTERDGSDYKPNPSRVLEFVDPSGTRYVDTSTGHFGSLAPMLRTCFIVYGSAGGGNSILGSRFGNAKKYGFSAFSGTPPPSTIIVNDSSSELSSMRSAISAGTVEFRLNGADFNPLTTAFSGGADMLTYAGEALPRQTQSLAASGSDQWTGGLSYGEIILMTEYLKDEDRRIIEAYLAKKWFGRTIPGYTTARLAGLTMSAGTSVDVQGAGPLAVGELSGTGNVNGSLLFDSDATITVDASRPVGSVTVSGTVTVQGDLTVRVVGNSRNLEVGRHVLLSADSVQCSGGIVLDGFDRIRRYSVSTEDGAVMLVVKPRGIGISFR